MRVCLRALGAFRRFLGNDPIWIGLPEGSDLQNLMEMVDRDWGRTLPASLWDTGSRRAGAAVAVLIGGRRVVEHTHPLRDGEEVLLVPMTIGG